MPTNIEVWAGYAKDRFESAAKRVDEFRNWARQLGAAVAVVVSLEITLVGKVLEPKSAASTLRLWCLAALLLAVAVQLVLLVRLLSIGYRSSEILGPESPVVLADYIFGQDEMETRRVIGAYYAEAYHRSHGLSIQLGRRVGIATVVFTGSTLIFFLAVVAWAVLASGLIL